MSQVLYHQRTEPTGRRLAQYLGLPHGRTMRDAGTRPDYIIRWGSAAAVPLRPEHKTYNTRAAITAASNKLTTLQTLFRAGISVPRFSTNVTELTTPVLARRTNTQGGKEIVVIIQPHDINFLPGRFDFYVELIPKTTEYRVHIMAGTILKVQQKEFRGNVEDYAPVIWNHEAGWFFTQVRRAEAHPGIAQAITAVGALGLDFGAVDLIIGTDDRPYVLEINTAPGLCTNTLPTYGNFFATMMGLTDIPGIAAVEWEDNDE